MSSMKKNFENELHIFHTRNPKELPLIEQLQYPFEQELLELLNKENPFEQEYYYLQRGSDYAFFIVYHNYMNIFTLGKHTMNFHVKVIGYPCSFSDSGFVTNNLSMMLDYIATMKGPILILNVDEPIPRKDFVQGQTLPTCELQLPEGDYLDSLRSSYRRRIKKAIVACKEIEIRENTKDTRIHQLYLNTYQKSEYKLERLEPGFFQRVDATDLVFYRLGEPVGFVLLKETKDQLIFLLCGMDYSQDTTDLYYYMLFNIVTYAIHHGYHQIDLGQTSEETKMKFGAKLKKKYFYAHHNNPLLKVFLRVVKPLLEYHYQFPNYRVFKGENDESTTDTSQTS